MPGRSTLVSYLSPITVLCGAVVFSYFYSFPSLSYLTQIKLPYIHDDNNNHHNIYQLVNNGAKVYERAKDTRVDFRGRSNHENAEKVAMATEFTTVSNVYGQSTFSPQALNNNDPLPGKVVLQDGRVLENIHYVIIATEYHTTFPFLEPLLERPSVAFKDADERVIITSDGRAAHNLHEDIFYIPDPTLAFSTLSPRIRPKSLLYLLCLSRGLWTRHPECFATCIGLPIR
ncbi:hypothetical protein F4820DRAFT_110547 [Hypoxylon rubiginosum]|uniref:Uncharacterized protein n=1 Tax=Hypoxylon rubiginosum TaxID=110542 RepID=A0ACB9YLS6_9PEZI|nr:hypothetical protein F4820DRAFT_110547 [Hypoxylon rubiginosum]